MANISQETLDILPVNKLGRAIQAALDNGYVPDGIKDVTDFKVALRTSQSWVRWFNNDGQEVIQDIEHVIYVHSFAKALWGDELIANERIDAYEDKTPGNWITTYTTRPAWQTHLQQMVVSDDPIAYLGEHL